LVCAAYIDLVFDFGFGIEDCVRHPLSIQNRKSKIQMDSIPQIRVMTAADIPAGMRLKDTAGWNQTGEDWRRFLQANPEGCFVAEWNGQVTGTVTTIIYEDRFAWIGMVLVDPEFRGKGLGSSLLAHAMDHLDARKVPCMKLDATPQGKGLYQRLGFLPEYEIERHILERVTAAAHTDEITSVEDHRGVLAMDRDVFGADRSVVLNSVAGDAPELMIITPQDQSLGGYALGRRGSHADHLGPWVARSAATAREVLERFLHRSGRSLVFVDVVKDNPWALALLAEKRFKFSRPLTRMWRGENAHPGRLDLLCAILGPEFG